MKLSVQRHCIKICRWEQFAIKLCIITCIISYNMQNLRRSLLSNVKTYRISGLREWHSQLAPLTPERTIVRKSLKQLKIKVAHWLYDGLCYISKYKIETIKVSKLPFVTYKHTIRLITTFSGCVTDHTFDSIKRQFKSMNPVLL